MLLIQLVPASAVITVTVTDASGNSDVAIYNTRIDGIAPTVTAGILATNCYTSLAAAEAAALAATTATDNCPGTLTPSLSNNGINDCDKSITVTFSDGCGNFSSVTYTNLSIHTTAPVESNWTGRNYWFCRMCFQCHSTSCYTITGSAGSLW